jgi:hypothetical protein
VDVRAVLGDDLGDDFFADVFPVDCVLPLFLIGLMPTGAAAEAVGVSDGVGRCLAVGFGARGSDLGLDLSFAVISASSAVGGGALDAGDGGPVASSGPSGSSSLSEVSELIRAPRPAGVGADDVLRNASNEQFSQ